MNDQGLIGFPWRPVPGNTHKEDRYAGSFIIWVV